MHQYSSLAQSVERMTVNHDVAGSSPAGGANKKAGRKTCNFIGSLLLVEWSSAPKAKRCPEHTQCARKCPWGIQARHVRRKTCFFIGSLLFVEWSSVPKAKRCPEHTQCARKCPWGIQAQQGEPKNPARKCGIFTFYLLPFHSYLKWQDFLKVISKR